MSILTSPNNPQSSSKELLILRKIEEINNLSYQIFNFLTTSQKLGINLLWKDDNLSAQEIIDGLGDNALKIFEMHKILTNAIVDIAEVDGIAPDIDLPTNAFSIVDGSIVVSEDPYNT